MLSKVDMGPIQIWGTTGRFQIGNPVHRNQPCKWPPTSNITLKELQWRNLTIMNYCTSYEVWEGLGAELAKWASKTVIHKAQLGKQTANMVTIKQWSIHGNDPQRSTLETTVIMATRAHMQARGETSPCGHPTDQRAHWTCWLEIILVMRWIFHPICSIAVAYSASLKESQHFSNSANINRWGEIQGYLG